MKKIPTITTGKNKIFDDLFLNLVKKNEIDIDIKSDVNEFLPFV